MKKNSDEEFIRFLNELKGEDDQYSAFGKTVANTLRSSNLSGVDILDLQIDILNLVKDKIAEKQNSENK